MPTPGIKPPTIAARAYRIASNLLEFYGGDYQGIQYCEAVLRREGTDTERGLVFLGALRQLQMWLATEEATYDPSGVDTPF